MSSGFRLGPEDESPHRPDAAVNFNESVYVNGFDRAVEVGGWMRVGNRVNEGHAEMSVCLYLPDGRIACDFRRPAIDSNDAFDAGGLRVELVEPLRRQDVVYEGELMVLDDPSALRDPRATFASAPRSPATVRWRQTGVSPVHGGEPRSPEQETMYGPEFSRGHFNQHVATVGEIAVGDERWEIDGFGWRDHSWGPRWWQSIYAYRLFIANFGPDRGLMTIKITDPSLRTRRLGVLLVDGRYEPVLDLDVVTDWTDERDPAAFRLAIRTDRRKATIDGRVLTLAPLRNRRRENGAMLESRIAEGFTRYEWDGRRGYGMAEYIERVEDGEPVGYPL